MSEKLWALFVPGPDDLYPAPSEAVARQMADKHNAAVEEYLALKANDVSDYVRKGLSESPAKAIEWPYDAAGHARQLAGFSYEEWEIEPPAAEIQRQRESK
jgi:hypothetical protein